MYPFLRIRFTREAVSTVLERARERGGLVDDTYMGVWDGEREKRACRMQERRVIGRVGEYGILYLHHTTNRDSRERLDTVYSALY